MGLLMTSCLMLFLVLLLVFLFAHIRQVLVWCVIIGVGICAIVYNAIFWIALGAVVLVVWGLAMHYIRMLINKHKRKNIVL